MNSGKPETPSMPPVATGVAKQRALAQRLAQARRKAFAPPYIFSPPAAVDKAAALADSLREGARVIVESMPSFVAGVEAFARVFDVAAAAVAHLDPQSLKIAAALHEIAQKLPKPAGEVAADLRRVASQIDSGAIAVN